MAIRNLSELLSTPKFSIDDGSTLVLNMLSGYPADNAAAWMRWSIPLSAVATITVVWLNGFPAAPFGVPSVLITRLFTVSPMLDKIHLASFPYVLSTSCRSKLKYLHSGGVLPTNTTASSGPRFQNAAASRFIPRVAAIFAISSGTFWPGAGGTKYVRYFVLGLFPSALGSTRKSYNLMTSKKPTAPCCTVNPSFSKACLKAFTSLIVGSCARPGPINKAKMNPNSM